MARILARELDAVAARFRSALARNREGAVAHVAVHMGSCGLGAGAGSVWNALSEELRRRGMQSVSVAKVGCAGLCSREPMVTVCVKRQEPATYADVTPEKMVKILDGHVLGGVPVAELNVAGSLFFARQRRIVMRNQGLADPESVEEYVAGGGYAALAKALTRMSPGDVIDEMKRSGLRGRGGAAFPAGVKWESCRKAQGSPKYVICNMDEGDPGAYVGRWIVESDPHAMIEGMAIAAYAVGAAHGFVYIRDEYPLARGRLARAIGEASEMGFLGEDIMGTGFSFDVQIARGAGAYVCGESSALRASIEGRAGEPSAKYEHATEKGLWQKPTVLNNVETFANVPVIVERGGAWYAGIGTEKSKGTKVFSLVGKVVNRGLVEVEMGTTLRTIVYEIGGGVPGGKRFKGVQTGGPLGGFLPASLLDMPIDYETLAEAGAMMGCGGLIVFDEDTCIVDTTRHLVEFCNDESCGRCLSCRDGSDAMLGIYNRLVNGSGQTDDIGLLEELCEAIKDASLCGLGKGLPNPVLSSLRHFRDEYAAHALEHRCQAGKCGPMSR